MNERLPGRLREFLFTSPEGENFELRTCLLETGEVVFHGGDLCRLLGHSNVTVAIRFHLDEDEAMKLDVGKVNEQWFVSRSGLFGLLMGSSKPFAKEFKRWLRKEVLVKIESQGFYVWGNDEALAKRPGSGAIELRVSPSVRAKLGGYVGISYNQINPKRRIQSASDTANWLLANGYVEKWRHVKVGKDKYEWQIQEASGEWVSLGRYDFQSEAVKLFQALGIGFETLGQVTAVFALLRLQLLQVK